MTEVSRLALLAHAGDEGALRDLLRLADAAVDAVNDVPRFNLELARAVARPRDLWPVHVGLHPDSLKTTRPFLEWLELGTHSEIGANPRVKWSHSHVATQYALKLCSVINTLKMAMTIRKTVDVLYSYIPNAQKKWPEVRRRPA
jgi:hypothetical protein